MLSHFFRKLRDTFGRAHGTRFQGGTHWHTTPAGEVVLPHLGDAGGLVVKENLQRTITRHETPTGPVYVKVCRVNTPRAFVRELLRPAKARLEFENAAELRRRGVLAIEPLAWGSRRRWWPSESVVVTREVANGIEFLRIVERLPSTRGRFYLARGFAACLADLHNAGVDHPDPHPGNFLVDLSCMAFTVTDVHAIRFTKPLSWGQSLAALTLLNRYFQVRASSTDRLRFWRAYLAARPDLAVDWKAGALQLEEATRRSNLAFWTARLDRYTADNRDSRRIQRGAYVGYAERDLPSDFVEQMLTDPDALFSAPGTVTLKDSRSSTVAVVTVRGLTMVLKRFRVKTPLVAFKNAVRPTAALRSWKLGRNLIDRGLPTARPLLIVERWRTGRPAEGYVAFEKLDDAADLAEAVRRTSDRRVLNDWADKLGRLLRAVHDREVAHRDLKAPNILMVGVSASATARPVLLDLVGVTVGRTVSRATRQRDLARLAVSYPPGTLANGVRLRFLRAYLGHDRDWKRWWHDLAELGAAKVARNDRHGRPLA
jgi:tRNA A-37 threonylcarbamoyl transferase component Bud32